MENTISKNWYMVFISGIIMILLTLLIFSNPADALLTYALYIGLGMGLAGLFKIIQGFQAKGVVDGWGWIVFDGLMSLIVGFVLVAHPVLTAAMLPFIFGFWAAFYGFYLVIDSFSGTGSMGMKLLGGILTVIFGFGIMFNPLFMGMSIAIWVAIILLIVGVVTVIGSFSLKNA